MRTTQIVLVLLWILGICARTLFCTSVEYDHRALVIDGKRRVLISGSIHYPRSTPEVSLYLCLCLCVFVILWVVFELKKGKCFFCCCRCGQTLFRNPKMEDWMWLRPMFSGTYTNQLEARFCSVTLTIFACSIVHMPFSIAMWNMWKKILKFVAFIRSRKRKKFSWSCYSAELLLSFLSTCFS